MYKMKRKLAPLFPGISNAIQLRKMGYIFAIFLQLLWAKDIYDRLNSDELAKNVPDADKLLEQHQERKVCTTPCTTVTQN